jgi:hypothetical protein
VKQSEIRGQDLREPIVALDQLPFASARPFVSLSISSCCPEALAGGVKAKKIEIGRCLISVRPSENCTNAKNAAHRQ